MRRITLNLSIIVLMIAIGVVISYSNTIKKESTPKEIVAKFTFGKQGRGLGEFQHPSGLAIKNNHLYIADTGNSRLQVFEINPDGNLLPKFTFSKRGEGLGELKYSFCLAIKDNYLYAANTSESDSRLQVFEINPDGNLLPKFTFGKEDPGSAPGEFIFPTDLAIKDNYLYIADAGNNRLQVFEINPDGSLLPKFTFGKGGKNLGEFNGFPSLGLAIKDNYLYVADTGNSRLQVLEIKY